MDENQEKPIPGNLVVGVIVTVAVLMATAFTIWVRFGRMDALPPMEVMSSIQPFSLTSQENKPFGTRDLKGKVWAATFVFTTCKGICPMLTATMTRLEKSMPDDPDFHMVSVSVDPEKDTPEVLAQYAERVGADTSRWTFLTGTKDQIKDLAVQGFKLGARPGERVGTKEDYDITHSNRIALVDRDGNVRAYFDGTLSDQYPRLKRAAQALLAEK